MHQSENTKIDLCTEVAVLIQGLLSIYSTYSYLDLCTEVAVLIQGLLSIYLSSDFRYFLTSVEDQKGFRYYKELKGVRGNKSCAKLVK